MVLTQYVEVRVPFVQLFGLFDGAARFTLCYNLISCSPKVNLVLYHEASPLGFLHQLLDSY